MATKKEKEAVRINSEARLRSILPTGASDVYTILRRRSASGMSRDISVVVVRGGSIVDITSYVCFLLGYRCVDTMGGYGLRIGGCGMDMGFAVVNDLGDTLGMQLNHRWL